MTTNPYILDFEQLFRYAVYLHDKEKATATVQKYIQDIKVLMRYQKGKPLTKRQLILWKEDLLQQYAAASVNTMIAAINSFLEFMGWDHLKVQRVRVQRNLFCFAKKELGKMEYCRLVQAAQDKKIRVSRWSSRPSAQRGSGYQSYNISRRKPFGLDTHRSAVKVNAD